jgi:1,4-dihydroxy-2-naphthoate octaprenyltransferase
MINKFKSLPGLMRLPFLVLSPVCVAIGVGTAHLQTGVINWWQVILVFIGALSAHISVNTFNEYFDYKSGLDARTQRTPFSGGSGTLPADPHLEKTALVLACTAFSLTAAVGLYFVVLRGWQLIPLGIIGLLLLVTYTIWFVHNPILCLVAPGLGFGVLMVMGTNFALTGTYTWTSFVASLLPTALVSNLLLLNQFPDVEADQSIGRRHFPIVIGRKASSIIYGALMLVAYGSVVLGIAYRLLPVWSALAFLSAILAWQAYQGARKNADNVSALVPSMGLNVITNLIAPVLLTIGLLIGK